MLHQKLESNIAAHCSLVPKMSREGSSTWMAAPKPFQLFSFSRGRSPRLPRAAQCRAERAGTLPVSRDDPPISPSPSFSSVFHSSCFLHKAGVSRDSSQMFSAAHHIAFLMKYSWSLSASCHESLQQLPAMETLRRQHSCKAPGPLLPARHLHLPLPPPTSGAGARLCPLPPCR